VDILRRLDTHGGHHQETDLMQDLNSERQASGRLERLLNFLAQDPENPSLREEAAHAAIAAGRYDTCAALLEGRTSTDSLRHVQALAWMHQGEVDKAARQFSALLAAHPQDTTLKFNLAYACALQTDYAQAASLLDDKTLADLPAAGPLKLRVLHHESKLDEALALAASLMKNGAVDPQLYGMAASIALDAERFDLADRYAKHAPELAESRTVNGYLALDANHVTNALESFEAAIDAAPENGRAWVGKGLAYLQSEDLHHAQVNLTQGAQLLRTHAGSWVAAGWACFLAGNLAEASADLETAVELSPAFAEAHGSLAVVRFHQGQGDAARRHTEIALRLDKHCLSGALAASLLSESEGNTDSARELLQNALNQEVSLRGRSIAKLLARRHRNPPQ